MSLDILCFSSTDWYGTWGSRQQVMTRLGRRGHRILFVERPVGPEHLLRYPEWRRRKWQRWRQGMIEVATNVWAASLLPMFPGRYYFKFVSLLNAWQLAPQVFRWLGRLSFNISVTWLYLPDAAPLVGMFGEAVCVYHCIDEWTAGTIGRKRRTIAEVERELLSRVDLVFANSKPTYEEKRRYNPNTHRVPSGADVEQFAPDSSRGEHPLLVHIPRPRFGYSGHVNDRLDYDLLQFVAENRPDWSLVFFGDTHPWRPDTQPLAGLLSLPNTHYLGQRPHSEVPHLLQGMDVCLVPYRRDEKGYYRSPLKLYEYLAAGKPVVSYEQPEARELVPAVAVASNHGEFLSLLELALEQEDKDASQRRISLANEHSWDRRVEQMEALVLEALASSSASEP